MSQSVNKFKRKTMVNLVRAWRGLTSSARQVFTDDWHPDLPKDEVVRLKKLMKECLHGRGGEVSARARTVELGGVYLQLSAKGKERFFAILASDFGADHARVQQLTAAYQATQDANEQYKIEAQLQDALRPKRVQLLKQFSSLPDGVKFLVDMRADLLGYTKTDKAMKALDADFTRLLAAWFDIGMLDMVQIDWSSSAEVLEKLIAYEAVHAIRDWKDLKNRLDSDRRCFAFFHPKMPNEPLIFVEVALVNGLADSVQRLLDEDAPTVNPQEADTAVFYSISNAQAGLAGISFGNFLIKRVVDKLSHEFPNLKHYATLSPIPGFTRWLKSVEPVALDALLKPEERKQLCALAGTTFASDAILTLINEKEWHKNKDIGAKLNELLPQLCVHYLTQEKHPKDAAGKRALDPVAHFHLTNGARAERLNWLADTSGNGMKQAAGMMVNYYYDLKDIDDNHEAYVGDGNIAISRGLKGMIRG